MAGYGPGKSVPFLLFTVMHEAANY